MKVIWLTIFQNWLPFKRILPDGIIQLKDKTYVKLIKVFPINYNLKSELEKSSILNSFKNFFKTCDFDIQVLIQSAKEDLTNYILDLEEEQKKEENKDIQWMYDKYINFIQDKQSKSEFSNKNFIIVIKESQTNLELNLISKNLTEKYYKVKENLFKCGNLVSEFSRDEVIKLLHDNFNV